MRRYWKPKCYLFMSTEKLCLSDLDSIRTQTQRNISSSRLYLNHLPDRVITKPAMKVIYEKGLARLYETLI